MVVEPVLYGEYAINYSIRNCKCSICQTKISDRAKKYRYSWFSMSFLVKLAGIALLWYTWWQCYEVVKDIKPLKTFVPHELLGVEADATKA